MNRYTRIFKLNKQKKTATIAKYLVNNLKCSTFLHVSTINVFDQIVNIEK